MESTANQELNENGVIFTEPVECYQVQEEDVDMMVEPEDGGGSRQNEKDMRCGWFGCHARWMKSCSSIQWFLVIFSLTGMLHYLVPFGLTYAVLTTLEKRFQFTSTQSGYIASAYQFSAMLFTPLVGYILETGNKPVWVGVGTLVLAAGSALFSVPHFLADPHQYHMTVSNQSEDIGIVCPSWNISNGSQTGCEELNEEYSSDYYWMFILAQILLGLAAAPVFTLGTTYLDENLKPKDFGLYLGISNAFYTAGPALGFFVGALTLSLYTNYMSGESIQLTPDHPLWVGAWWVGFIAAAAVALLLSLLVMGFPRTQPGSERIAEQRKTEAQKGSEYHKPTGFLENLMAFPKALYKLLKNLSFMGNCLGMASEWFVITGLAVFLPKFFESQLNMSSSEVAGILGVLNITAQLTGSLGGGIVVERLDLKFKGLIKMILVCVLITLLCSLCFLMYCPMVDFAGVTHSYSDSCPSSPLVPEGLNGAPCNAHCDCRSHAYDPVCGTSNNVMYYSACHAGCTEKILMDDNVVYTDCQCLSNATCLGIHIDSASTTNTSYSLATTTPGKLSDGDSGQYGEMTAVSGGCGTSCRFKWPFFILIWPLLFFNTLASVPNWAAAIRCVSHSQRAFAIGVTTVVYCCGTSVAPIIFGLLIDHSCLLWESLCNGSQICWLYDNRSFSYIMLGLILVGKFMSLLFFGGTYLLYVPIADDDEEEQKEVVVEEEEEVERTRVEI